MKPAENLASFVRRKGLIAAAGAVSRLPDGVLTSLIRKKIEKGIRHPEGREFVSQVLLNLKRCYALTAGECRKKFLQNFIGNYLLFSSDKRKGFAARYGWEPPLLYVISPTMKCNLTCYGCYSANYKKKDILDRKVMDRIFREGKEIGLYYIVVSGGEPFLRDDLLDLFEEHDDMYFMVYTNATMIRRKNLVPRLARLGNVFPCISVEGFEKETDARRGKGVFRTVTEVMDEMKETGMLFGFSATCTKENNDLVTSDEFVDFYISKGCFLGWYFQYMPVGRKPDIALLPTPEQRIRRRKRIIEIRRTRPILLADFWNDGPLVGGCLSGGRVYFHITADGRVDPCVFAQFSTDSILEKSMIDILHSPYFTEIRRRQREMANRLRPCMIIDRPQVLRDNVQFGQASASQKGGEATVTTLAEELNEYAREYTNLADEAWVTEYGRERETGTEGHLDLRIYGCGNGKKQQAA